MSNWFLYFLIIIFICTIVISIVISINYISKFKNIIYIGDDIPLNLLYNKNINFIDKLNFSSNNDIKLSPILIINVKNEKERLHHILKQCIKEKLYAIKFGACCNGKLSKETESRFTYNNFFKRNLLLNEKKCFISHEKCLLIASNNKFPTLILEDDVSLPFNFKNILNKILIDIKLYIEKYKIKAITVRLGREISSRYSKKFYIENVDNLLLCKSSFDTGTWAYIVTPEAAKTLLDISNKDKISWQWDHFINPPYNRTDCNVYDKRIPDINNYRFFDIKENDLQPKHRYKLKSDNKRNNIVQELSTDLIISSTSKKN